MYLKKIHEQKPLIHHLTNFVTIADCAQVTRLVGALPVMAHAPEEVEDMANIASALVLNIGTLTKDFVAAQILAAKKANEKKIPVVLDIVGCGATRMRTEAVQDILGNAKIDCIKGNKAEISVLAGAAAEVRGVEGMSSADNLEELMRQIAAVYGCIVVATGAVDIITDGKRLIHNETGHELMGKIVGTGCMAASLLGCFLAVSKPKEYFDAAAKALEYFGKAGEKAAGHSSDPMSFKICFLDEISRG